MANERDLALCLIQRAQEDLDAVQAMLDLRPVADAVIGLHAHQAVQRSLKAVLAISALEYPFTHDIDALAELCEAAGTALPAELDDADHLTPYAAAARYDDAPCGSAVQRETAGRWAQTAVSWAQELVAKAQLDDSAFKREP